MRKSKFHYAGDIFTFGILGPGLSVLFFREAIKYKIIPLNDTVLIKFIKSFSAPQLSSGLILFFICLLFFGSIRYCIQLGIYRTLIPEKTAKPFIELLNAVGISTYLVLLATLVLSELQLSLFTTWIAFITLIVAFFKLSINSDSDKM